MSGQLQHLITLADQYQVVRKQTLAITETLEPDDFGIQTAPFMSPAKWHLGHTSWFFENVVKGMIGDQYRDFDSHFNYCFNSYYQRFGERVDRADRGLLSRPTLTQVMAYRDYTDEKMLDLLEQHADDGEFIRLTRLGLEHEMQHQELLVMDIKHLLRSEFKPKEIVEPSISETRRSEWISHPGGLVTIGAEAGETSFAFDNEKPKHKFYLEPFSLASHPVSVGEFLEFMVDGGYADYRHWYDDGWALIQAEGWQAPLYWVREGDTWFVEQIGGRRILAEGCQDPVVHVSYYEACAFAAWAGKRLPNEAEWEVMAPTKLTPYQGNFLESLYWQPIPAHENNLSEQAHCQQMLGDVWEWTTSDYSPYPGFQSDFREYNDKWMVNQRVLRGGSFATPKAHIRSTYRNFYFPKDRWQCAGFRLAT